MKDHRSVGIAANSLYNSYEFYFGRRHGQAVPPPNQEISLMQPTSLRAFHNALRILHSLDHHEVPFLNDHDWDMFRDNPYDFFIITNDAHAQGIWRALQARQPLELREDPPSKFTASQEEALLDIAVMFENWERDSNIADPTGAVRGQRRAAALAIRKLLKKENADV